MHSCLWDAASLMYKQDSCCHRSRRSKEDVHFLFKTNNLRCQVSTCSLLRYFTTPPSSNCSSPSCSKHRLLQTLQKEPKWRLDRNCSCCLHLHPFKALPTAHSFALSKWDEQLVRRLGRVRSCKCLFWGNALLMLLNGHLACTEHGQKVNKITFLSPWSTHAWWELFPPQALALSLWPICSKVAQEKSEPWFFLHEQRCICSPWVEISAFREPQEDLGWI